MSKKSEKSKQLSPFAQQLDQFFKSIFILLFCIYAFGYFVIDSSEKYKYYPWKKISGSEFVEIRPALINDRIVHDPTLPTYVEVSKVHWARSTGLQKIEGIHDYYCFIDGVAWIPCTKLAMETVSGYLKQNPNAIFHSHPLHWNNAPEWYKRRDQR